MTPSLLEHDDIAVGLEGERLDPLSILTLPVSGGRPDFPRFTRSAADPFLRAIEQSGRNGW